MSFGIPPGDASPGQSKVWSSVLSSTAVGPYAVKESKLLKEALTAVRVRPEIAEQLAVLQEPPQLEGVLKEQRGVIMANLAEQLERTRQLGLQLHGLLITQMASDPEGHARFTKLAEAADGLHDVSQALYDASRKLAADPEQEAKARRLLTVAWERRTAADALLRAQTSPAAERGRQAQRGSPVRPSVSPGSPRTAIETEIISIMLALIKIEERLEGLMTEQITQASERADFRNLETEWNAARADLGSTAESTIHGLVLTVLNSAVAAQFALRMQVRSLDGLRETITNEKVVNTSSFERLESMIDRHGEGSFGIAGPRGVGKSTLIKFFTTSDSHQMARAETTRPPSRRLRLGVSVAAPVAYDAREFVLHLHAEVCRALLGPNADRMLEVDVEATPRRAASVLTAVGIALAAVASIAGGAMLVAVATRRLSAPDDAWTYAGLVLTTVAVVLLVLLLIATVQPALSGWRTRLIRPWLGGETAEEERYYRAMLLSTWGWPALALTAAVGLSLLTVSGGLGQGTWMLLGGTAAVVLGATLLFWGRHRYARVLWHSRRPHPAKTAGTTTYSSDSGLRELALDQLRRTLYEQTLSSEHSMTLRLGGARQIPVGVDVGSKQGSALAERPMTYPEIVSALRAFLETVTQQHQLVIAVDELDKLRSAQDVENFLNDIKGVFGASRCFFLVSISEEAAASFERRGMPFRDVFDSCFDNVLTLQRLEIDTARKILYGLLLGWTEPFVALCYVLSGGLPRELHRSARELVGQHGENSTIDLLQAVPDLMRHEAAARLAAVRHGLLREACGPDSLALVSRIELIDPTGASTDQFREWYKEMAAWCRRQFAGLRTPNGLSPMPAATRMGCELAAFMLFAATVIDFFGQTLTSDRLQQAQKPGAGGKSLAKLADARHALSLSPWTSVGCVTAFRDAWDL
ncbi:hypothetical protein [Streptomyces sp. WAC 05379]|uniref:hypothetical protein n=1 Tax=Streptomyces sp. WAC 05379 TaxID=2203207 RepID=UPI000F7499FF|nr:hypothetical protein [Streptomyces sp. WAC 05379]